MSIEWTKDGRAIIIYWPNGRYAKKERVYAPHGTTQEEAEQLEILLKKSAALKRGKVSEGVPEGATVNDLFPEYLAWYELYRAKSTYRDISGVYYTHLSRHLGNEPIASLNQHSIDYYIRIRRKERGIVNMNRKSRENFKDKKERGEEVPEKHTGQISNRTIMKELTYFSGFLKWCRNEKMMQIDPLKIKRLPSARPLPIVLSVQEVLSIVEASEPYYRAVLVGLYSLGLRIGELRSMTWEDIDLENNAVRIRQKGGTWKLLPLGTWFLSCLAEISSPGANAGVVFLHPVTRQPIGDIRAAIKKAAKKAGIQKKITPHLFRHSVATHLLGGGTSLRIIQGYLGHKRVSTTEFYTHVGLDHLRNAYESVIQPEVDTRRSGNP